ncbi:MAG: SDR family oxidoreductase [Armatimonadota bacterium]
MKVLFIGGTGIISSACTRLAAERGIEMFLLNRGTRDVEIPAGVTVLNGDIRNLAATAELLKPYRFDAVVDWIAFAPENIEADLALFAGKTEQYIFISSASAYQKPPVHYKITESTPLYNPFWGYSRNKIACEERVMAAYRNGEVPGVTIVRPSFTFGETYIPYAVGSGYTIVDRMKKGQPIIVHGDGQSLWTITHNTDFAKGFVGLLGNQQAIGESFHITSDEVLTWDQIAQAIGSAAGVEPKLIHIPSEFINRHNPGIGAGLLGDKGCSMVMDNSKIKRVVPDFVATMPFKNGVKLSVEWAEADPSRMGVDEELNTTLDTIIAAYERAY